MPAQIFPFWIVERPHALPPVALASQEPPAYAAAFTSLARATEFVTRCGDEDWEFRLVCRSTYYSVADRLRWCGIEGVCFEPDHQGRGERIGLDEMDRFLRSSSSRTNDFDEPHVVSGKADLLEAS